MKLRFIKKCTVLIILGVFILTISGCNKKEYIGVSKVDLVLGYNEGYFPKTTLIVSSTKKLDNVELLIDNVTFNYRVYYNQEYIDKVYLSIIEIVFYKTNPITTIKLLKDNREFKFNIGHIEFQKMNSNHNKITGVILEKMVRLNSKQEIRSLLIKNNMERNLLVTDVLIPSNIINPYTIFTILPSLTSTRMLEKNEEIEYGDIYVNKENKVLNVETILNVIYIYEGKEYIHNIILKSSINKENISFLEDYEQDLFEVIKC